MFTQLLEQCTSEVLRFRNASAGRRVRGLRNPLVYDNPSVLARLALLPGLKLVVAVCDPVTDAACQAQRRVLELCYCVARVLWRRALGFQTDSTPSDTTQNSKRTQKHTMHRDTIT